MRPEGGKATHRGQRRADKDNRERRRARLEDYSEIDLMTAWLKKYRARGATLLTRLGRTEVRHVCLYASQKLSGLREEVLRPEMNAGHTILEVKEVIADLEGLVAYLEGKGGFSALHDKERS